MEKPKSRIRTLVKTGGSRAVIIPPDFLRAMDWHLGDIIRVEVDEGTLRMRKMTIDYPSLPTPDPLSPPKFRID